MFRGTKAVPKAGLGISLILLFFLPASGHGVYRIAVEQLQPEEPSPGDTVVFKVTMINEASWSGVVYAEVVSPDGVVYPVANIRSRAGNYLPSTAYVSFNLPDNALPGNYTLLLRSHDHIYNEAGFYVFEKKSSGVSLESEFSNNTLTIRISSPSVIRDLEVELLSQLQRTVEVTGNTSRTTYLPVDFRPLGLSYRYLGDVAEAEVSFRIIPQERYIRVPVRIAWRGGERVITWSGEAEPEKDGQLVPEVEVSGGGGDTPGDRRFLLPAAVFFLFLPSILVKLRKLGESRSSKARLLEEKQGLFDGGEGEVAEKWAWMERCLEEGSAGAGPGRVMAEGLKKELGRRLSPRETTAVLDYLTNRGALIKEGGRYRVEESWKEKLCPGSKKS
jgi:hypothetical protein